MRTRWVICSVTFLFLRVCFSFMHWFFCSENLVVLLLIMIMMCFFYWQADFMWKGEGKPGYPAASFGCRFPYVRTASFFFFKASLIDSLLIHCTCFYAAISVLISAPIFPILKPFNVIILAFRRRDWQTHVCCSACKKLYKEWLQGIQDFKLRPWAKSGIYSWPLRHLSQRTNYWKQHGKTERSPQKINVNVFCIPGTLPLYCL